MSRGARPSPAHFRAHERRSVHLTVALAAPRSGADRQAVVVDISLAGACLETEEPLVPGERVALSFATPTLWDPLVLTAVVAWSQAQPVQMREGPTGIFRNRAVARSGVAFDYSSPETVLATYQMLATLGYE